MGQCRALETERWIAARIGAKKIVSLDASHASLASQPEAVVALIEEAAKAIA